MYIQCKWMCVFSCMWVHTCNGTHVEVWGQPQVLALASYLFFVTGSPSDFVLFCHWIRQASWPTSFPGPSYLHLPCCYRNTGIIEMCFCTHLYVGMGIKTYMLMIARQELHPLNLDFRVSTKRNVKYFLFCYFFIMTTCWNDTIFWYIN